MEAAVVTNIQATSPQILYQPISETGQGTKEQLC